MPEHTRRQFLSALGAAGVVSLGPLADRAVATDVPTTAAPAMADPSFADSDEFESFVDDLMARRVGDDTPGMSVAIVEGDDVVLAKGYGYADAEAGEPVRADETAFRIGSVSKLVTYTAVMQGVGAGTLDLDEDVTAYLDDSDVDVPATYDDPVTLRHLGTHTAGFESQVPGFVADPADLSSVEQALIEDPPDRVRPPGETVEYSNYGAMLAGHVVAAAHDTTFSSYVHDEILEPLGMDHSTFAQPRPDDVPGSLAAPHERDGNQFTRADPVYVNPRPAGSMSATATDMATFMHAHLGDGAVGDTRLLDPETHRTMHDRHYVRHRAVNNWRYGFYEFGPPAANLIAHSGGTLHYTSQLVIAPEHDIGLFVNYNASPSENVLAQDIGTILREFDLLSTPSIPDPTTDTARADRTDVLTGEYSATFLYDSGPGQVIERVGRVSVYRSEDGRIVTDSLAPQFGGGRTEWVETDPYVFHAVDGSDVIAFDVIDGDVQAMYVNSLPQTAYEPVPVQDRQAVTGGVVGGALGVFGLSLLGLGARGGYRRWRDCRGIDHRRDSEPSPERSTHQSEETNQ